MPNRGATIGSASPPTSWFSDRRARSSFRDGERRLDVLVPDGVAERVRETRRVAGRDPRARAAAPEGLMQNVDRRAENGFGVEVLADPPAPPFEGIVEPAAAQRRARRDGTLEDRHRSRGLVDSFLREYRRF